MAESLKISSCYINAKALSEKLNDTKKDVESVKLFTAVFHLDGTGERPVEIHFGRIIPHQHIVINSERAGKMRNVLYHLFPFGNLQPFLQTSNGAVRIVTAVAIRQQPVDVDPLLGCQLRSMQHMPQRIGHLLALLRSRRRKRRRRNTQ